MHHIIRRAGQLLLDLLFPPVCPFCRRPWHRSFRAELRELTDEIRGIQRRKDSKAPASGICPACRSKVPVVREPYCLKCGKPIEDETAEYCYDCSHRTHAFDEGRALYPHTGAAKRAVYELKYGDRRVYGVVFAREMARHFNGWMNRKNITMIVPVPLHRGRLRERGYNQAAVIAKALADEFAGDRELYREDVLARETETKRLKTLSPLERRIALEDAFRADLSSVPPGMRENILVVDDIYTTGSTVDAAAKCLKRAGANHVFFLAVTIGQGV